MIKTFGVYKYDFEDEPAEVLTIHFNGDGDIIPDHFSGKEYDEIERLFAAAEVEYDESSENQFEIDLETDLANLIDAFEAAGVTAAKQHDREGAEFLIYPKE